MRYVQLRAFHHVATQGGFSRAADALNLTQPAVSDQVRRLEQSYDLRLFDRRQRQITLTPDGAALLAITRRMFEAEAEAMDLLTEAREAHSGQLTLIADSAHHLLPVIAAFRARYPAVHLRLSAGNSQMVLDRLRSYDADIGVLGEDPDDPDVISLRLDSTPILACVPRSAPWASRPSIPLQDLTEMPLVLRETGSKTRAKLEAAMHRLGLTLTPVIEAEGREAVRELVAAGAGVGFISQAEFGQDTRLTALPLTPSDGLDMQEAVICLRARRQTRLVRAFFDLVAEHHPPAQR